MSNASKDETRVHDHAKRRRRLVEAFYSPDSYGLVVLLIVITYWVSAIVVRTWAVSLVLAIQMITVWVALRASRARRAVRLVADVFLIVAALALVGNLLLHREIHGERIVPIVSGLLYFIAPLSILRHLVMRRTVDRETVLGAIASYLLIGMFFAFFYQAVGANEASPFFGPAVGDGKLPQYLFFSFTTLTTTGYGNLVPAGNPGQSFAVLEMLIGQLFLVAAVGKVISAWRPGQATKGLREPDPGD